MWLRLWGDPVVKRLICGPQELVSTRPTDSSTLKCLRSLSKIANSIDVFLRSIPIHTNTKLTWALPTTKI